MRYLLIIVCDGTTTFTQTTAILKRKPMSMGRNTKLSELPSDTNQTREIGCSHNYSSMC